jgi:hypothetical protein
VRVGVRVRVRVRGAGCGVVVMRTRESPSSFNAPASSASHEWKVSRASGEAGAEDGGAGEGGASGLMAVSSEV